MRTRRAQSPDRASIQRLADILALEDERLHADLVQLREEQGLSQQDVADLLGVSQPTISTFERYDNDPKLSTLRRYALAIGALVEHRVGLDDGRPVEAQFKSRIPASIHFGRLTVSSTYGDSKRTDFAPAA